MTTRRDLGLMEIAPIAKSAAAAALLLVVASGCSDSPEKVEPGPEPTTTTPSSSITTSPPSDSEVASEAASELVRTYYAVRDELRQSPDARLSKLKSVATSTELAAQQNLFRRERKDGLRQTGVTKVAELRVQAVDLDNSNPKAGRVPTVQIDVCFDVTGVDILNASGKSVVSSNRPETGWIRYSVSNYKFASNPTGAWRVASSENLERTPCAAS